MESKVCSRCKRKRPMNEFLDSKGIERNCCAKCREQRRLQTMRYNKEHREEKLLKDRLYKQSHREELKAKARVYYYTNRDIILKKARESERVKEYERTHREQSKLKTQRYREKNRELIRRRQREYYWNNVEHYRELNRTYGKKMVRELTDRYIKMRLDSLGFPEESITPELIELKRAEMLLNRTIKNYDNEKN